jgi:hypothetical protein
MRKTTHGLRMGRLAFKEGGLNHINSAIDNHPLQLFEELIVEQRQ